MAKWEVTLQQQRVHDTQKARIAALLAKDSEFRAAPDRRVRVTVHPLSFAFWKHPDEIEIRIQIIVTTAWVYPARLRKLAGWVHCATEALGEIDYIQEHEIPPAPMGGHAITRSVTWRPTTDQCQRLGINRDRPTLLSMSVEGTAYLTGDHGEFEIPFQG